MPLVDHLLRVHVRLALGGDVARVRSGADLCLPAASTMEEVLPEVLALMKAPQISLPWEARTPAGQLLDLHEPLCSLGIGHGSVIVLGPKRESPAPLVKDAAEALVDGPRPTANPAVTAVFSALAGVVALGAVVSSPALGIPLAARPAILALACFALLRWPHASALVVPGALACAAAATWAIGGPRFYELAPDQAALAVIGGALFAFMYVVGTLFIARVSALVRAAVATASIAAALACPAAWLFRPEFGLSHERWWLGYSALLVVVGIAGMLFSPGVAGSLAGLKVPRIPSAGHDLAESDRGLEDPDAVAGLAIAINDGIHVGCGAAILAGAVGLAQGEGVFAQALALSAFVALALHAHRQASAVCVWSSWVPAAVCVVAVALAAGPGAWGIVLALPPALILVTAPAWSARVPELEPTTISWFERVESLAVAATLPLALHLAGFFAMVRALG